MKQAPKEHRKGLVFVSALVFALCAVSATAALLTTSSDEVPSSEYSSSFVRARRLLDEGRIGEAKAVYADELKRDSKNIEAIRGLALCARDEGDDETALQYFQKLTALAPKDLPAWRQLAQAASRLGRDMEAVAAAQTALSLSGNKDRAMSDLMTRILTSDPDHLANPKVHGADLPWGVDPAGRTRDPNTFDPLGDVPRPEPPDPTKGLPVAGGRR